MDIVIDTSSIIAVVLNEPTKSVLVENTENARLFAPRSVHWEIGNAFSAMLKRRRVALEQAVAAVEAYHAIPLTFVEVDLVHALKLSYKLNIYAYDAYLIACAQERSCPLLSLDNGLMYAAQQEGVAIISLEA